ncbi:MAG: alginate export family protein [Byssovorax sp.]
MIRSHSLRLLASASSLLALCSTSALARAQATPLSESIVVGAWTFRPSLELRVRGEYRRHPVDTGGAIYSRTAVLGESYGSTLPERSGVGAATPDQLYVSERSRLGLAVDRGPVTGVLTLQDARVLGGAQTRLVGAGQATLPSFAPYEAYLDVHTRSGRRAFLRLGRQRVTWGDGRLVGANDWSLTGRSLDAARLGVQLGDVDVEAMGVLLAAPGNAPPAVTGTQAPTPGMGAQLYGVNAMWHLLPLLHIEITGLARVVREPAPASLVPSDTVVIDGRISGDHRGFRYAVEGAYELGRVASYGVLRDQRALALAARLGLETALPWHVTFGVEMAYATGDNGDPTGAQRRFDPILPDEHSALGPMGLFAWSNVLTAGASVAVRPIDEVQMTAGYRFANLADPKGRWTTAELFPVGASTKNTSSALGHEIDYAIKFSPWKPIDFEAGYGLFLFGDGAREILIEAGRPARWQHWGFLQTTIHAP